MSTATAATQADYILTNPAMQIAMQLACVVVSLLIVLRVIRKDSDQHKVYPIISGMATGNPRYRVTQDQVISIALKSPHLHSIKPVLERIYGNTRIATRHMAIPDFTPDQRVEGDSMFFPADGSFRVPVEKRLQKFYETAIPLVTDVARRAIQDAGLQMSDISKLSVVSSTGIVGPGLDCELIETLGLSPSVDRTLIGFMGCAAAITGFRNASDYVTANPGKNALMICIELPSVHTALEDNMNNAIVHAIFGDGCAAAVLTGVAKAKCPKGALAIVDNHAYLMQGTKDGIGHEITSNGITARLSKHLPSYVAKNTGFFVDGLLSKNGLGREDMDFWCVHPGGRRVIEEAAKALDLTEEQTADSWAVLRDYGNMTSPCVMFVLQRVWKRHNKALQHEGKSGYKMGMAFSFSPGMGAEGILLKQISR